MNNLGNMLAHLVIVEHGGLIKPHTFTSDQITIGRVGGANDIFINSGIVSSQHGIITYINGFYVYNDLATTNGTIVSGKLVKGLNGQPSEAVRLKNGDVLSIGSTDLDRIYMLFSCGSRNMLWNSIPLNSEITIGRDENNIIVIPNITASRKHAKIAINNGKATITDLNSSNGTIVNGSTIKGTAAFKDGDVATIGTCLVAYLGGYIVYGVPCAAARENSSTPINQSQRFKNQDPIKAEKDYKIAREGGVQVEVDNISRLVKCKAGTGINGSDKKYILQNVSLTINPGELIAILGGSGAGKTTFMNAINGFEPATEGRVLINGVELYKNYQSIKSVIGYVPQQDIVHDDLTLEDMLMYTGKLRLPKDITKKELVERVDEVLDMVELAPQRDTYIKKLSGGQRKRASIAVELISDPSLFFLDEPTSGLDPEAETNLMRQLEGLSAKKGKTVIVITHTLQNIRLFDKVIFLAPGGKLCFYGSPKEAEKFFNVDNLVDAYEIILKDIDGTVSKYNEYARRGY